MKLTLYFVLVMFTLLSVSEILQAKSSKVFSEVLENENLRAKLHYLLTEIEEFKKLFGEPQKEETQKDGETIVLNLIYPDGVAVFVKRQDPFMKYWLSSLQVTGKYIDIGRDSKIVLRNKEDLKKFDGFAGFSNVSLKNLDLREELTLLQKMPFDTRTEWPLLKKLPLGFNPKKIFETTMNPGLGLQSLHHEKIDGQGIGIAIIDQPLFLGHNEYSSNIVYYNAGSVHHGDSAMHASAVASIAVGKNVGVAPMASLYFFAVPTWEKDNQYYANALNAIVTLNKDPLLKTKIRVVSISFGGFSKVKNPKLWEEALENAKKVDLLVVTCAEDFLDYGILSYDLKGDINSVQSYQRAIWMVSYDQAQLWIPGQNRVIASEAGNDVYTFDADSGVSAAMSWGAPYLAGIAALGYQINPNLKSDDIVKYWLTSTTETSFGKIINPKGFIDLVKKSKNQ